MTTGISAPDGLPLGRHTYVAAVTGALHSVLLAAAGAAALAFVLTWFPARTALRAAAHGPGQQS